MARKLRFLTDQVHKANMTVTGRSMWERVLTVDELEVRSYSNMQG